jgi:hypothetical protein
MRYFICTMQLTPEAGRESSSEIVAAHIGHEIAVNAVPPAVEWQLANPITFSSDWRGKNPDPLVETEVRVLWSEQNLYIRFNCRYRELYVFDDSDPNGRRDHLWERDVAEVFLQPTASLGGHYMEFEVSPNGMWVDLDIFPGGRSDLKSGVKCSAALNELERMWQAEMTIPLKALTESFNPCESWRVNFYRVEGHKEPRTYLAWQPTHTREPNFHVPEAFGGLRFAARRD